MKIKIHQLDHIKIAEILTKKIFIISPGDALDLLGTLYFQSFDKIIIHQNNLTPDFFDLKTGIAGEILQKFSNYRVRLAVIGNFSSFTGKSFISTL